MRPEKRFLWILLAWFVNALVIGTLKLLYPGAYIEYFYLVWWSIGIGVLLASIVDFVRRPKPKVLIVERELPNGLAVGVDHKVPIYLTNEANYKLKVKVTEYVDSSILIDGLPIELELKPDEKVRVDAQVHPTKRGDVTFHFIDVLMHTPWNLWSFRRKFLDPVVVKVFPDFAAISHFELLANGQQVGQLGIHLEQRRGEGTDFHQLRDFRQGDSLRQVDWKATARARKPISKEFQDEKDQDIIFLLDNGRRMRTKDNELSHFDHCLNAFLLTAYIALRQGDAVGFQMFGNVDKWMSPIKGKNNLNTLLHQVYDLHSSVATSDYLSAAQKLINRHSRRSLVVVISNVHQQDGEDLLQAFKLLSKNHLVIIACLREGVTEEKLEKPIESFGDALIYSSANKFEQERKNMIRRLIASGAIVLDDEPSKLHIALVNEYYALKRSGRI